MGVTSFERKKYPVEKKLASRDEEKGQIYLVFTLKLMTKCTGIHILFSFCFLFFLSMGSIKIYVGSSVYKKKSFRLLKNKITMSSYKSVLRFHKQQ